MYKVLLQARGRRDARGDDVAPRFQLPNRLRLACSMWQWIEYHTRFAGIVSLKCGKCGNPINVLGDVATAVRGYSNYNSKRELMTEDIATGATRSKRVCFRCCIREHLCYPAWAKQGDLRGLMVSDFSSEVAVVE